jgi:hypothetical protein
MGKLIIEAGNDGDMSVGIPGLGAIITIEANVNMKDVLGDIHYKDNYKIFIQDIKNLLHWIDDMDSEVHNVRATDIRSPR